MSLRDLLYSQKSPTSKKRYVGIEIEFLTPSGKYIEKLRKLLIEKELAYYCHLGVDGSVDDLDFQPIYESRPTMTWDGRRTTQIVTTNIHDKKIGHEIRILAQEDEAPEIVRKVCDIISASGGTINKTCGLHVHIDLRSRDYETVYNNMFMVQDLMFKTQPKTRTVGNKFCRKLGRKFKNPKERYYAINSLAFKEHKTIEIRLHEPTLSSKEILMWTGFLIQIANIETALDKKVSEVEQLSWLPESLKGYLNERIEKYSGKPNTQTA